MGTTTLCRPEPPIAAVLDRLREKNPLPDGALPVAVGLAVNGAALFGFLILSKRMLSPADYAALAAFWGLLYAVGNGVMQPLEQEIARAVSARRAKGIGAGPVIRRAGALGAGFTVVLCAVAFVTRGLVLDHLFDGSTSLELAFLIGLFGFCSAHLTRGSLSSHGRFGAYGVFFSAEGLSRVMLAGALGVLGVSVVGAYGLVFALASFLAVGIALAGQRDLLEDGPPAEVSELSTKLGWLLLGTVSLSFLLQGGVIAVKLLAPENDPAAGQFLDGLLLARIPLFLFQAVLASLLPKLSRLASEGAFAEFSAGLRRLVGAILALGAVATVSLGLLGPAVVGFLFPGRTLSGRDLALLTAASILVMAAICVDQALVALNGHSQMALGWLASIVAFTVVTAVGTDLISRVELGMLAGAVVSFGWMVTMLTERMRHHRRAHEVGLAEVVAEIPID